MTKRLSLIIPHALFTLLQAPNTFVVANPYLSRATLEIAKKVTEIAILLGEGLDSSTCNFCSEFTLFRDGVDEAAVLRTTDGYCMAVFRGTSPAVEDWMQNINPFTGQNCGGQDTGGVATGCCDVRSGFNQAYDAGYRSHLESVVNDCVNRCDDHEDCLILGGHSQGAAIASIAAIRLAHLNPQVVAIAPPPAVHMPCSVVSSQRWYNFINSGAGGSGLIYDLITLSPGLGADYIGRTFLLSDDDTGAAYVGINTIGDIWMGPHDKDLHSLYSRPGNPYPGYLDRIEALLLRGDDPVRTGGIVTGGSCNQNTECQSRACQSVSGSSHKICIDPQCSGDQDCGSSSYQCQSHICVQKLPSCAQCSTGNECSSGICSFNRCAEPENGLLADGCDCFWSSECVSGRCEGWVEPICFAPLPSGSVCDESSDCQSSSCSWMFICN
jgi:pimeloyl-ACP methyl ester carboxylesterase